MSVRHANLCVRAAVAPARPFVAAVALLGLHVAVAQNIVENPHLDTSLPPWTTFLSAAPDPAGAGSLTWVATPDANDSAASGSASVVIDTSTPAPNAKSGMHQCVTFASTSINFVNYGASVRVPVATAADGAVNATIELRLFSDAACSAFIAGGSQGRTILAGVPSDSIWYTVGDSNFSVAPAQVAQSAEIRAYLRQTATTPTAQSYGVYFDEFHLVLNSTTPVRLQAFGVD